MKISVIIAAGGVGKRFGGNTPKQYMKIDGVTVLDKALSAFSRFDQVIVAGIDTPPGPQRQDTVAAALEKVTGDVVLIHDAARPFISEEVIERVVKKLEEGSPAVIPCVRPKNTIRTASETLNRDELYEVQTPQGFDVKLLKEAFNKAFEDNFCGTDDASVVEYYIRSLRCARDDNHCEAAIDGCHCEGAIDSCHCEGAIDSCHCEGEARSNLIDIVEGDYANIKITTRGDMPQSVRFGNGYDVHRLVEGRKLMLGCTEIPYEKGLLGHSDADVLSHAMADALLGAASLGDIGRIFPDSGPGSEATEGMAGSTILSRVAQMVREQGYEIMMIDGTVIAEKPKLMPHIETMRANIAKALNINIDQVSVKATTEENMSDVSRNGMAAIATCTLKG